MTQRREAQAKTGPVRRRDGVSTVGRKFKDEDMARAIAQAKRDHEQNGGVSNRSSVASVSIEEELSIAFRLDRPISVEIDKSDCFGSEWEFSKPQKEEEKKEERERREREDKEREAKEKDEKKERDERDRDEKRKEILAQRDTKLRRRRTHDPSRMQSSVQSTEAFKMCESFAPFSFSSYFHWFFELNPLSSLHSEGLTQLEWEKRERIRERKERREKKEREERESREGGEGGEEKKEGDGEAAPPVHRRTSRVRIPSFFKKEKKIPCSARF